jgi:hypothetical protein
MTEFNYDDLKSRIENGKWELNYNATDHANLPQDNSSNQNQDSI